MERVILAQIDDFFFAYAIPLRITSCTVTGLFVASASSRVLFLDGFLTKIYNICTFIYKNI
jgi:hypothetical protein